MDLENNYAGLDLGTTFSKLHDGQIFASGYSEKIYDGANNIMTVEGKKYTMELFNENAEYDMNSNKALNKNIRLDYLYGLHKLAKENTAIFKDALVSLPANQWDNEESVNMYKELLSMNGFTTVDVNGISKDIFVDNVGVVPEDFPAYYAEEVNRDRFCGDRVLMIGIGSFNSNQYLIENDEIIDSYSNEMGCLKLFQKISSKLGSKFGITISIEEVYKVLTQGLYLDGERVGIQYLVEDDINEYCLKFIKDIKLRWSVKTIPYIISVGGGSIVLTDYLRKHIPHIELQPNAQKLAAKGMLEMLRMCGE